MLLEDIEKQLKAATVSAENNMKNALQRAEIWRKLVPTIPEQLVTELGGIVHLLSDLWPLKIDVPLSFQNIDKVVKAFVNNGWQKDRSEVKADYVYYRLDPPEGTSQQYLVYIDLNFQVSVEPEKTECVIKKIGEKVEKRVVPIFEVICPEGAKEDVFETEKVDDKT